MMTMAAQTIDKAEVAFDILDYSVSVIAESLPQDMGSMIMDKVSLSDSSCDYYYTIKDDDEFAEYLNNKSQVKKKPLLGHRPEFVINGEFAFIMC